MMQKKMIFTLLFSALTLSVYGQTQRTDGPPGSEYGDFSDWDGTSQIGIHLGAMTDQNADDTSLSLGLDFDYRPTDVFGIRASVEQGLQDTKHTIFLLTPLVHSEYSNMHWYFNFGPGLSLLDLESRKAKFLIAFGVGGDFMFSDSIGVGLFWNFLSILGAQDLNNLGARFSYQF
jgi:hypothetical protein